MLSNFLGYLNSFNFSLNFYTLSYVIIILCIGYVFVRLREGYYVRKNEFYKAGLVDVVKAMVKIEVCYVAFREYTFELNNVEPIKDFLKKQNMIIQETANFLQETPITLHNKEFMSQIQLFAGLSASMSEMYQDMIDTAEVVKEGKKLNIEQYYDFVDSGDREVLEHDARKNIIENTDKEDKE